ncbi:23S rRNA (uracil(1939)-C(5))-methyltransferase RlmD [Anaerococcus marasmi]|uniref:23S rRNA (uracil(1939)-C(5))-methyltransferase RlmD n=1 Tax=Anaerococcus marasmi TaxID=2057797 RepID=UPI000CF864C6|nr:23S rRNA (uracil(1939)-C(5))-methyltransferase RlmD [Anaerococcus marasmi]
MIIKDIKIIDILQDGRGVGKKDSKVYFIEGVTFGETCDIEIIKEKKNFIEARKVKTTSQSPYYTQPPCPYYYECGGCTIMDINYDEQIELKKNLITKAIKKTCDIEIGDLEIITSENLSYRNKIRLQVDSKGRLSYNKKSSNDLVAIKDCKLANNHIRKNLEKIQNLVTSIVENLGNIIREISIRSNRAEILLNIYSKEEEKLYKHLKENYKNLPYNINIINKKKIKTIGKDHLIFKVKDKSFKVSRDDFYQVNDYQIENLYEIARTYLEDDKKLLDLFCGSGISSIALNDDNIVGIEINKSAIKDALENARRNNLDNYKFIDKNAKYIDQSFIEKEKIQTVTVDPPRAGLDKEIIKTLANTKIKNIIYISCNPQTLARDIKRFMDRGYEVKEIKAVDMFPQTMHVETIALIQKM